MLVIRALVSGALLAYLVAVPADRLLAVARVWTLYAAVDTLAALGSIVSLPSHDGRFTTLVLHAIWDAVAALTGIMLPTDMLLMLFVVLPLWSVGSVVLAVATLQQTRTVIEAHWLITIVLAAAAAFAAVYLGAAAGDTTWLRATLASSAGAGAVVFLLTASSVRAASPH